MKDYIARLLCLGVLFLTSTTATFACLNTVGRSTVGDQLYTDELSPREFHRALTTHKDEKYWLGVLAELQLPGGSLSSPIERQINTAVAMLHLGMVKRAIAILEELERTNPGDYYTAANLGTAYELNGENAKALRWIKEGISRDPDAHNGSEWLHVRILEAKLALETDQDWLATNSVIGLERFSNEQLLVDSALTSGNRGEGLGLKEIETALIYQLHERLEFIDPPEGVVANLLYDLSRTLVRSRGTDHAAIIRSLAQSYGPDLRPWSAPDPYLPAIELPPEPSTAPFWIGGIVGMTVLLVFGVFVLRRQRSGPMLL
ncbi:MAG TPA: hypothetical protein VNA22_05900 [Pyrinomonadaceae bacterium]|nr:hypothetical protein [Pyrinomonadaceae bacterium]